MMKLKFFLTTAVFLLFATQSYAQNDKQEHINPEDMEVDMDNPTFVPMYVLQQVLDLVV